MADAAEVNAQETFSGTKAVDERYALDEAKLAAWMQAHVEGYKGPLEVRQFKGGQSNRPTNSSPLLRTTSCAASPPASCCPPPTRVDREYKVISALGKPPGSRWPSAYALCTDDDVIGTMFYIMSMVDGRILWDGTLPDMAPDRATRHLFRRDRHPGGPAQHRLRGYRPGGFR